MLLTKIFASSFFVLTIVCNGFSQEGNGDKELIINYLQNAQNCLVQKSDSCHVYANKAIEIAYKLNDNEKLIKAQNIRGQCYVMHEDFTSATQWFLKSLQIAENLKDMSAIANIYRELGTVYRQLENYPKALNYFSNALKIYESLNDTLYIGSLYSHLGELENAREYCQKRTETEKQTDLKRAIYYYEKSLGLAILLKNNRGIGKGYQNIGNVYRRMGLPQKALENTLKAFQYFQLNNDSASIINAYYNLGLVYAGLRNFREAKNYYTKCINESVRKGQTMGIQFIYEELAYVCDQLGDYKGARDNYIKYMILRDSIYNAEKSKQLFELETKYQTVKKEKEISQLKAEKMINTIYLYALFIALIISGLTAYFIYRNIQSKRVIAEQAVKIQQQKLIELEKDHQILASQLVLQGEETERQRLARDLHDGLGGMLSGIKLSLSSIKGNAVIPDSNLKEFDGALIMLDSSIKELRRVAHNMMPEALIRFGLKDAIQDVCLSLNEMQNMKIVFQFLGLFSRVEQNIEIGCFRIIQELVNNALKHSGASEMMIQMIQEPDRLCFIVQDNGKGYYPLAQMGKKGIGLASIKSRLEAMNGTIDINASLGMGAEFTVEVGL